ncbi:MAG: DNA (cytosine-5-)-methyltransferase [Bacteroidota bacterium]
MKHASLFSGIGGFDLAAKWMGWQNIFQVEIDPFCIKVLKKIFPKVKRYADIKKIIPSNYTGRIDILTGGFPCQPFSQAGSRRGKEDDRYLWPEMLRIIRIIKPTWIIAENVSGILTIENGLVFEQVCFDLEATGYEVQPLIIPACSVNAPHKRQRIWFMAHANCDNDKYQDRKIMAKKKDQSTKNRSENSAAGKPGRAIYDKNWLKIGTKICRNDDGLPFKSHRLKALGNSIVPQIAYEIFKTIS